jgi:hypothetical protein
VKYDSYRLRLERNGDRVRMITLRTSVQLENTVITVTKWNLKGVRPWSSKGFHRRGNVFGKGKL